MTFKLTYNNQNGSRSPFIATLQSWRLVGCEAAQCLAQDSLTQVVFMQSLPQSSNSSSERRCLCCFVLKCSAQVLQILCEWIRCGFAASDSRARRNTRVQAPTPHLGFVKPMRNHFIVLETCCLRNAADVLQASA